MRKEGFIMLQRRFFDHDFWEEKRKFSKAEAFIDLIQSANFAPNRVLIGNTYINLERGQQVASLRFLSKRWGWSTFKVSSFLKLLFEEKMVLLETKHQQTVLTLCNYDTYNKQPEQNQTETKREPNANQTKQNKDKKNNNTYVQSAKADADAIWKLFPATARTRSSQHKLASALAKHKDRPDTETLVASVTAWAGCHEWTKEGGQYAPAAHRWANERKWEDTPEQSTKQSHGTNTRPLWD